MTALISEADFARLNWYQRQRVINRLTHESARLRAEARRIGASVAGHRERLESDFSAHFTEAKAILDGLPADSCAAQYRVDLDRALRPAKGKTA